MELKTLSATKIKTYSSCPRKYMYEYVDRLDKPRHPAAVMGTAVHKAIDTVYTAWRLNNASPDPKKVYWDTWAAEIAQNEGLNPDRKLMMDGLDMIEKYDFSSHIPINTEVEFRLPFPNSVDPICEMHGFIDQIFDNGLKDMKTNKRKPATYALNNDLQFIIYRWAFTQLTGEIPEFESWFHLRTQEDIMFDLSTDKTSFAVRIVERILESQEKSVYDRSIGDSCLFCSYKSVCLEG